MHLTANYSSGWPFASWSGDASGNANPLTVTTDGDKTITATFVEVLDLTTLAGTAGPGGSTDGTGGAASFTKPISIACDSSGDVYVADNQNHTIRRITPAGEVSTFAGAAGQAGSSDGTGSTARFSRPWGVAFDSNDNLYVADSSNDTVRKITPAGVVTTLAGAPGQPGSADGTGATARFNLPTGLACDASGNIYVADLTSDTVRKITPAGVVTTLAGTAGVAGSTDSAHGSPLFNHPVALACDASGNVYVADQGNNTVRRISASGVVTTVAGTAGMAGLVDGMGSAALFDAPSGIACDAASNIYVADYDGQIIRRITAGGVVNTVAGSGAAGSADGRGNAASFNNPAGITCDAVGNLYIADSSNNTIRRAVCPSTVGGFIRVGHGSHGTISLSGQSGAAPAVVPAQHGDSQAFTIIPDAHYHVTDVVADGVSLGSVTSYSFINVAEGHALTASFAADRVALTVNTTGMGSVVKEPDQATYDYGSTVQLSANAGSGYVFSGWSGGASGSASPATVTMNGAMNVTATFAVDPATLLHVMTVAGTAGVTGSADGSGAAASFASPMRMACDPDGDVYLADTSNSTIRKVSRAGVVTTFAGSAGQQGSADGSGSAARFSFPSGVACDSNGNVYVADTFNHTIRKISPAGVVTTLAGSVGQAGNVDGTGGGARFDYPIAAACDAAGNVYVSDNDDTIRKVTPAGVVTTLAGSPGQSGSTDATGSAARFSYPAAVVCDASDNVYVADSWNSTIRKITPSGVVTTLAGVAGAVGSDDGMGSASRFNSPNGIACDTAGNLFVTDSNNDTIRRVTPTGVVTTVAGSAGTAGTTDGAGSGALFNTPIGVACDAVGNVYIGDFGSYTIRKGFCPSTVGGFIGVAQGSHGTVSLSGQSGAAPTAVPVQHGNSQGYAIAADPGYQIDVVTADGVTLGYPATYTFGSVTSDHTLTASFSRVMQVTTFAGDPWTFGSIDGTGASASFNTPVDVTCDATGNVYVADENNSTVRKITPAGAVTTFAGLAGYRGSTDGTGSLARFFDPQGLDCDSSGNVYVADTSSFTIRKITPARVATTFAGSANLQGSSNGTGSSARFYNPVDVACDPSGNVYVADCSNDVIRKITPAGVVSNFAGSPGQSGSTDGTGSAARFDFPDGVDCDASGNVYVTDSQNDTVRKITPSGVVSTFAGVAGQNGSVDGAAGAARFSHLRRIECDSSGSLYVTDNDTVRLITPTGVVTTVAGSASHGGHADGWGRLASLLSVGIACDTSGNVYVADGATCIIRKLTW